MKKYYVYYPRKGTLEVFLQLKKAQDYINVECATDDTLTKNSFIVIKGKHLDLVPVAIQTIFEIIQEK